MRGVVLRWLPLLAALCAPSAPPAAADGWPNGPTATGDWGGVRSRLSEKGWDPFASYVAGVSANVAGGIDRGARYIGFAEWGLDVDLATAARWPGAAFHIEWISYHGGKPSESLIGTIPANAVSGYEAEDHVRFYTIFVEQLFWGERGLAKLGQLAADDDLFLSEWAVSFQNSAFGDFTSVAPDIGIPIYPIAAPGAYLELSPTDWLTFRFGAYTGDVGEDEDSNFGFDWSFDGDNGAGLVGEITLRGEPFDRPGAWTFGVLGNTGDQPDYRDRDPDGESDGVYGIYAMLDQTLWIGRGGDSRIGVFLRGLYSPQEDRSVQHWTVDGGIVWRGPLAARPDDELGFAFAHERVSDDYASQARDEEGLEHEEETILELIYNARIFPWLSLQPNVQLVLDPGFADDDAYVLGLQAVLDL